jgi:hypothetical protein
MHAHAHMRVYACLSLVLHFLPCCRVENFIYHLFIFPMVVAHMYVVFGSDHVPEVSLRQVLGCVCALDGTLVGAAIRIDGMTTLRSCDEYQDLLMWSEIVLTYVCDLV